MPKFRGALRSPRHLAFAAKPHLITGPIPPSFGVVPKQLSIWGNDKHGDCVSAEEAFAKAAYSTQLGFPEVFVPEDVVITWARRRGFLNGAVLTEVMDAMRKDGMVASDSKTYHNGPYQSVDWTDDAILSSAIYAGPVKIGVAANQLENAVNSTNDGSGWFLLGARGDNNMDHCVSLCGYGTLAACAAMLGVAVPAVADPSIRAYLLFTWNSIGVIDRASLLAICGEAWLRTPTTAEEPTPKPTPTPDPTPTPTPTPVNGPTSATVNIGNYMETLWIDGTTPPAGAGPHPAKVHLGNLTINITAHNR